MCQERRSCRLTVCVHRPCAREARERARCKLLVGRGRQRGRGRWRYRVSPGCTPSVPPFSASWQLYTYNYSIKRVSLANKNCAKQEWLLLSIVKTRVGNGTCDKEILRKVCSKKRECNRTNCVVVQSSTQLLVVSFNLTQKLCHAWDVEHASWGHIVTNTFWCLSDLIKTTQIKLPTYIQTDDKQK